MVRIYGKRDRSRKKLMHVAKGLYEEHGIENVTFNQIAEEAEMCRSTVFNHFATSKELMAAIYNQGVDDIADHCKDLGLEGEAYIREFFYKLIEDSAKYPALTLQLITNAIISHDGAARIKQIEVKIKEELPPENADNKAIMLLGMYYGVLNHHLVSEEKADVEKMQAQFEEMIKVVF